MNLDRAIIKACQSPAIYPDIEARVDRLLPRNQPYTLGIALASLCSEGRLFFKGPDSYTTAWPLYCVRRTHAKNPKRAV